MSAADNVREERVELAVLSCLLNGTRVDDVPAPPEAFSKPEYRAIFSACLAALRRLRVVDPVSVQAQLELDGAPREVVDLVQYVALADCRPGNLREYLAVLLDYHARRIGILAAEKAIRSLADPRRRVDVATQEAASVLATLGVAHDEQRGGDDVRAILSDYRDVMEALEAKREPRPAFLAVPDAGLCDGANPFRGFPAKKGMSCLGVVAARSGTGKTARLSSWIHHWLCTLKKRGGLFGLEDGTRWLVERWVARDFGMAWGDVGSVVPEHQRRRIRDIPWVPEHFADVRHGAAESYFLPEVSFFGLLSGYERLLDERLMRHGGGGITSPQLLAKCRRWIDEGAEWIAVDHGLRVDYVAGRDERLDLAIKRGVEGLSTLSEQTGVPIILAWHLNRSAGSDELPPAMKDVKESGYLDATAATVLGLWRNGEGRTFSNVIKSRRSGAIGRVAELPWADQSGMFAPHLSREVDLAAEYAQKKTAGKQGKAGI
jgi:replicative DNA helicase